MKRKEDKCRSCIFKAKRGTMHKCDYASLTGHTRMAVPPEKCVNYVPNNAPGTKTRALRTKPDWEAAMALYKRGLNDVEIAEQKSAIVTVCGKRRRMTRKRLILKAALFIALPFLHMDRKRRPSWCLRKWRNSKRSFASTPEVRIIGRLLRRKSLTYRSCWSK